VQRPAHLTTERGRARQLGRPPQREDRPGAAGFCYSPPRRRGPMTGWGRLIVGRLLALLGGALMLGGLWSVTMRAESRNAG
jgi:hypothetical protein